MNNNILKRALEELSKEKPNIDYVRGMLETLIEMTQPLVSKSIQDMPNIFPPDGSFTPKVIVAETKPKDEGQLLDAAAAAKLNKIKEIAAKSVEQS